MSYFGCLGGAGVVDGVLLHVVRQPLAVVLPLFQLGVSDVPGDNERPCESDSSLDAVL